ncbi:DNA polymerase III subunit delta [Amaricoccus solimangrovi]|uniref:DNA-directed DNA polymerase n=1 Tax=Amaricoccus solimangrovi TaxID=2589815 RepID=A0A501WUH6_9RHOB|nr:DNA polymerase III subunit delta [Amaricoccus solimangrovi]TPE52060.1 DNA polymerase III subunit delta [Amaricoccus solimangrovi]
MKLAGRDAARYLDAPDPKGAGALLHGPDSSLVALRRAALVPAMIGPAGAEEMRLTRIGGADLRRDPAALADAVKAIGFFPGPRLVLVEEAGDGLAPLFAAALDDWRPGDARLLVTAGQLNASSALRKLFEKAPKAVAIGLYADPPGRAEIGADLAKQGVASVAPEALADLEALGRGLEPGEFAQFLIALALYKQGDPAPLSPEEVAALAPRGQDADLDTLMHHVAEGRATEVAREIRRLAGQTGATGLTIAAARHFRALHAAAIAPEGAEAALSRARPPVFGPRRARMARQATALGPDRLERALGWIVDTELDLRSSRPVPAAALVERLFIRIAMLRRP